MAFIHFICRNSLNLRCSDPTTRTYQSGNWMLSADNAQALVGGMIYLHQNQASRSYFGGQIESFERFSVDGDWKVIFTLHSLPEGKGVSWRGKAGARIHSGGVVQEE